MNYKFKTTPYKHQLIALEKSWNKESYAYLMEMGTGKTKVLIDNAAMLYIQQNGGNVTFGNNAAVEGTLGVTGKITASGGINGLTLIKRDPKEKNH